MPEHRQSVREYLRATEALLKTDKLSEEEVKAIVEILHRVSEKLLTHGTT